MSDCRYCGLPIEVEPVTTLAYWNQTSFACHAPCKSAGEKAEALDCQTIDADCNDCRYYQRGQIVPKVVSLTKNIRGKIEKVTFQPSVIVGGRCLKFDRPTIAYPHMWTGMECFEHRRPSS